MEPGRLAEIRAGSQSAACSTGSGYLIGRRLVLTAWHIVAESDGTGWSRIVVWLGHPRHRRTRHDARLAWSAIDHDIALLELDQPPGVAGAPVRWGTIEGIEQVRYTGIAFPAFADYGDTPPGVEQLAGAVNPLTEGPGGSYALDQDAAPEPPPSGERLWSGASGAAVFCAGLLTGVVIKDDAYFGNRRLHAGRIGALITDPEFSRLVEADTGEVPSAEPVAGQADLRPGTGGGQAAPFRYEMSAAILEHASAIVGRDGLARQLMAFSAGREGGYALVEAPAGFGKTTLVASLWQRHAASSWEGPRPDLIGFSIRRDLAEHTAAAFLAYVTSQLAALLGRRAGAGYGRKQFAALWRDAVSRARADRPLLLVIDGLDEISPERPGIADLLPDNLAAFTHVIVTSRPNPQARFAVPPHHPLRQALLVGLPPLSVPQVGELLRISGCTEPAAWEAAVHEVTRGEPLLARFAAEDVAHRGQEVLASYRRSRPADVAGYFRWQLDQLEADASDDMIWEALALLLVATGGLTDAELADALGVPAHRVRRALAPVNRFLMGPQRRELMHEELAAVLSERLSASERRAASGRLLSWCRKYAEDGWPDETPHYVLSNATSHAAQADDYELAAQLISRRRLELLLARARTPWVLHRDAMAVLDILTRRTPPDIKAEISATLSAMNMAQLAAGIPPSMLGALVNAGDTATAEAHAALADPAGRCRAFKDIAVALWHDGRADACGNATRRAIDAALACDDRTRSSCLDKLGQALLDAGAVEDGRKVVRLWAQSPDSVFPLTRLAPALIMRDSAQFIVMIAEGFHDVSDFETAHALVALALAEAGHLDQALGAAGRIEGRAVGYRRSTIAGSLARLSVIAADNDQLGIARELARKAEAMLDAHSYRTDSDLVGVAAAWARLDKPRRALRLISGLSWSSEDSWTGDSKPPEARWWYNISWADRGWSGGTPRRDAIMIIAHQAVRAGAADALLEAAGRKTAEFVGAAVAIASAHAGEFDRAFSLLPTLTTEDGRVQVLLAFADCLVETSRDQAAGFARQALDLADNARATVAILLARAGQHQEAIEVAQAIEVNGLDRGPTFIELAKILGLVTEPSSPSLITRLMFDSDVAAAATSDEAFGAVRRHEEMPAHRLVRQALAARDLSELQALLAQFDELGKDRFTALTRVVRGHLEAGNKQLAGLAAGHALSVLPAGRVVDEWSDFLSAAVRNLARTGRARQAMMIGQITGDPWVPRSALKDLIAGLLEAGQIDSARSLTDAGPPGFGEDVARMLYEEGLDELAAHLSDVAQTAQSPARRRGEEDAVLATLIAAPDGADLHAFPEYAALRGSRSVPVTRIAGRLVLAGRFETAVAVILDDQLADSELPSRQTMAVALAHVAARAFEVPGRREWAHHVARESRQLALAIATSPGDAPLTRNESEADRAVALAAVTAYAGWPDDLALDMLREAISVSRGHRHVFFSMLAQAVPFLSRLGDGVLESVAHVVIDVDSWWMPRAGHLGKHAQVSR
jgi:hypothetical protein